MQIELKLQREESFALMIEHFKPTAIIFLNGKYSALIPYTHEIKDDDGTIITTLEERWFGIGEEIDYKGTAKGAKKTKGKKTGGATVLKVKIVDMNAKTITFQHSDQADLKKTIRVKPKWPAYKSKSK